MNTYTVTVSVDECPAAVAQHLMRDFFKNPPDPHWNSPTMWRKEAGTLPNVPLSEHNHPVATIADDYCPGCSSEGLYWARQRRTLADGHTIECWVTDDVSEEDACAFLLPDGRWLCCSNLNHLEWYVDTERPE